MQELKKYLLMPLVLIGALNWGLIGMFNYNLVSGIIQDAQMVRVIYSIVGLAAFGIIILMFSKEK